MAQAPRTALAVLCSLLIVAAARAQDGTPPPTPEQLAAMERVRPRVEAIWLDVRTPSPEGEIHPRYFWEVTDQLIALGPDVVPFLTSELDLMDPSTFHFSAYALGRLGGPEAEAALRKAVRAANARGGRFGEACKRFALYGLALLGEADVVDLLQTGESMHTAEMLPDLPLVVNLALLVGPPAAPLLEKQFATYAADPAATDHLEDTLLALGRVGDASLVPKLKTLLSSPSPEVRGLAADAIARLGQPSDCESLVPLLSSTNDYERRFVAKTFARWKPEPCYKAMVGRLEVESDIGVRGSIYNAIVAMGGESALDVFRLYLQSPNQFDQALAIIAVGQIGSKKGLNMLRSLLTDERIVVVVRALQSIGAIGGEGATDTLLAATSDRRFDVATAALDALTDAGVEKVAPRVASELLSRAHDPVGDLTLRTPIARWGDDLVKFGYTDPIEDVSAAAAVQTDPEIKESMESCVRRLRLIAKNGDDVAAWTVASASPLPDVRRLADRRLAQIGSAAAVRTLAKRLEATDLAPDERAGILLGIADARTRGASELVERHLSEPAYDAWELREVRAAAAYAARRIGGDRMARALRASAVRRDGRDWATLVYLAVLEKRAALPTLRTLRVRRLRYPDSPFGHQEWLLDGIVADLAGGREIKRFDVPPEALSEL